MTPHQNHQPAGRRGRRGVQIGATALVVSAAFGAVYHQQVADADDPPTARAHAPTSHAADDDCLLWDGVPVSGLPRAAWESAAEGLGLSAQGPWVSADGLTWEHLDGSVIVVASPRPTSPAASRGAVCHTDRPARNEATHSNEGNLS